MALAVRTGTGISFSDAVWRTLDALEGGGPLTRGGLAERTGLDPRAVRDVLQHVTSIQQFLGRNAVVLDGKNWRVTRAGRRGLASLPGDVQNMIIRTVYHPTASREEEILVHLLARGAVCREASVTMRTGAVLRRLVDAGHVQRGGRTRYYLSEDGRAIADGALELYPEILGSGQGAAPGRAGQLG